MAGIRVAVIDDWQNAAPRVIDWSPLAVRAELQIFSAAAISDPPTKTKPCACWRASTSFSAYESARAFPRP